MKHLVTIFILILSTMAVAQLPYGYCIDGKDVVFTCDLKDYDLVVVDDTDVQLKLDDLKVNTVAVSGTFNNWKSRGWKLNKKSKFVYELRKPVDQLNTESGAAFKFVVNDRFWLIPPAFASNTSALDLNLLFQHVYEIDTDKAAIDDNGHIFKLYGYENATKVILSGTFNDWSESRFKMKRVLDHWELPLKLQTGFYEYRFIVDGHWMEDPMSEDRIRNEFGEYNSVINKLKTHHFKLKDQAYKKVYLAGSFSDWQHQKIPMEFKNGVWQIPVNLSHGAHQYKFIVDDQWILDPTNESTQYGVDNELNSVIFVK